MVELDGGQHARPEDGRRDVERTRLIEERGYRVLRFWNRDVLGNVEGVLAMILEAIERARSPSP